MAFHIQLWLTFNRFTQRSSVRCNKSFSLSHCSETFIWLSNSNESNSLTVFWLAIDHFKVKWFETTAALVDIKVDLPQSQTVPSAFSNRIHRWDSSSSVFSDELLKMWDFLPCLMKMSRLGYLFLAMEIMAYAVDDNVSYRIFDLFSFNMLDIATLWPFKFQHWPWSSRMPIVDRQQFCVWLVMKVADNQFPNLHWHK